MSKLNAPIVLTSASLGTELFRSLGVSWDITKSNPSQKRSLAKFDSEGQYTNVPSTFFERGEQEEGDEAWTKRRRGAGHRRLQHIVRLFWMRWQKWILRGILVATFMLIVRRVLVSSPPSSDDGSAFVAVRSERTPATAVKRDTIPSAPIADSRQSHAQAPAPLSGLQAVDEDATSHPLYDIIARAKTQWAAKVQRQSKTLKEAFHEYQRRYGRVPPKGFEEWWYYCMENNVQMVDEYDQIHRDLFLFRAYTPATLRKRIESLRDMPGTFSVAVDDGVVTASTRDDSLRGTRGVSERMDAQVEFLAPISKHLGNILAVFNAHDYPRSLMAFSHSSELIDRIEDGDYWEDGDPVDTSARGFPRTCPPSSKRGQGVKLTKSASFITDWRDTMDVCKDHSLLLQHSAFADRVAAHGRLEPFFSLSSTIAHSDITVVPLDYWTATSKHTPWEAKVYDKLVWRGKTTGGEYSAEHDWRNHHRFRLVSLGKDGKEVKVTSLRAKPGQTISEPGTMVSPEDMLDIGFFDKPAQCKEADGTCDEISHSYQWMPKMSFPEAVKYKYVMDVDGNGWSARFKRLLDSGSLVFKSTVFPEWWTDRLEPWVHFVPIQVDYSDLLDTLHFMRENDDIAREIADAGVEWAATHWRKEDMVAYMFRLYLEWDRLLSNRRQAMDFDYSENMERVALDRREAAHV